MSSRKVGEVLEAEGRESGISRGSTLWTMASALSWEQWVTSCPSSLWAKTGRRPWNRNALPHARGQWWSSKAIVQSNWFTQSLIPRIHSVYLPIIYLPISIYFLYICNLNTWFKYFPRSRSTELKDKASIILMLKKRCTAMVCGLIHGLSTRNVKAVKCQKVI